MLRARGINDVAALTVVAVPPTASDALTAIRHRRTNPVALAVLATMALGLLAALVGGGPARSWSAEHG